jgi:hypothetical protein
MRTDKPAKLAKDASSVGITRRYRVMSKATLGFVSVFLAMLVVGCASRQDSRKQTIDEFLTKFGSVLEHESPQELAKLLLPPDDTPEGKTRTTYVPEYEKAVKYDKKIGRSGQKIAVSFKDTQITTNGQVTTINTTCIARRADGKIDQGRFILNVTLTEDGWKLVSYKLPDGA